MPPSASSCHSSAGRRNSFYARHNRSSSSNSTCSTSSQKGKTLSRGKSTSPLNPNNQLTTDVATKRPASIASCSSSSSSCSSSSFVPSSDLSSSSTFHVADISADTSISSALSSSSSSSSKLGVDVARNMLFQEEYQDEVIEHMSFMEKQNMPCVELMDVQPELRWFMRPYLVNFLIEIHQTFKLKPETLFLTMNIVDRYVSKRIVYKKHFQLVGCAALLIAAKFEDSKDRVPTVGDLSQTCCKIYDESAFVQMEAHVLTTIGWFLGHPTAEAWLRIESVRSKEEIRTINVARFFLELSLFHRDFISLTPSSLMQGALMLARFICGKPQPDSNSISDEATKAAHMLDTYMSENLQDLSSILIKKYSYAYFSNASVIVCHWYRARCEVANSSSAEGLLPAQTPRSAPNSEDGEEDEDEIEEVDDDDSMCSRSPTPSSMHSTPSRSMDEDEEDEDDMPVTPLSLYSLHNPLVAAAAAAGVTVTSTHHQKDQLPLPPPPSSQRSHHHHHYHQQHLSVIEKENASHPIHQFVVIVNRFLQNHIIT